MEIPVNNRVILSKKSAESALILPSGVVRDTDFFFVEILFVAEANTSGFKIGQIVCVPQNKVYELPVLSTQSMEFYCQTHDILYITKSPKKALDKTL
jgi:hypothetical protein